LPLGLNETGIAQPMVRGGEEINDSDTDLDGGNHDGLCPSGESVGDKILKAAGSQH